MNIETIRADMVKAMKEKDKLLKDVTSSLIAAIKKVAIDEGVRDDITEELVDRVILKELKSTKEQIDTCPDERAELKAEYQAKYDIIATYAPKQLSEDEIIKIITEKFAEVIATKNKGLIMKSVMGELKGKADGKLINQVVAKLCEQKIVKIPLSHTKKGINKKLNVSISYIGTLQRVDKPIDTLAEVEKGRDISPK